MPLKWGTCQHFDETRKVHYILLVREGQIAARVGEWQGSDGMDGAATCYNSDLQQIVPVLSLIDDKLPHQASDSPSKVGYNE